MIQDIKNEYDAAKLSEDYLSVFKIDNPLVSVCIATYNRCNSLLNIALPSVLEQTYKNIEIIVVGDCCTDNTEVEIKKISDPRIKFLNMPVRGNYETDSVVHTYEILGVYPTNKSLEMSTGDFITYLDDDDSYSKNRIEILLQVAKTTKAGVIYHPFTVIRKNGERVDINGDFSLNNVTTSAIFYHKWFKRIQWNDQCWKEEEPRDWNLFKKFVEIGATVHKHNEFLTTMHKV